MRRIVLAPLILAISLPVKAEVFPYSKIHEMCISAVEYDDYKDYKTCVKHQNSFYKKNLKDEWECTAEADGKCIAYKNGCTIDTIGKMLSGCGYPPNYQRQPEQYVHKGKTYIASRVCEPPRKMVWTTYPSFLGIGGKVEEAGCMTPLELEAFNREMRLRRASRPVIINNPAPVTQPSGGGMIIPMYQKPINCTGVNYGGAGFSASCY